MVPILHYTNYIIKSHVCCIHLVKDSESLKIKYFIIEEFFGFLYIVGIKETSFEIVYSTR